MLGVYVPPLLLWGDDGAPPQVPIEPLRLPHDHLQHLHHISAVLDSMLLYTLFVGRNRRTQPDFRVPSCLAHKAGGSQDLVQHALQQNAVIQPLSVT